MGESAESLSRGRRLLVLRGCSSGGVLGTLMHEALVGWREVGSCSCDSGTACRPNFLILRKVIKETVDPVRFAAG
jgi:hypothetical protein